MAMETEALPVGLDLPGMTPEDLAALRRAVRSLEHPGLAARLTNMVGKPIELIGDVLPASASHVIATATSKGLEAALKVALRTMQHASHAGSQFLHKALATASGAAGGAFGLATLPIELPVSTIIMLAAQALPVIGALGGAAVNYAFIQHFQEVARGHFTVRRLERVYGKNVVRTEYERLAQGH
jgi:hypothetical protein